MTLFFVAAFLTPLETVLGEGVPIIFSGRDGRPVRFNFSRRESLVPPELRESRLTGSSGDAAFLPLVDPSVTPNSGSGRRRMNGGKPERDWIFQNPGELGSGEKREDRDVLGDRREPAMMKFMRGDEQGGERSNAPRGGDLPDDQKAEITGNSRDSKDFTLGRKDRERDFSGLTGKREPFWSRFESDAGMNAPQGAETLQNFFQAEQHREREQRHQEKMTDFRQMLSNPFAAPSSGSGFGGGFNPAQEGPPGVGVSLGMPDFEKAGGVGLPGVDFGKTAGIPNAFDTPKVPSDLGGRSGFQDRKPEPIRRQIRLDIPKRDF